MLGGSNATPLDHDHGLSARPRRPSGPTCTSASRTAYGAREIFAPAPAGPAPTSASRAACSTAKAHPCPTAGRDLAGRQPGPLRPSCRRPAARLQLVSRLRPLPDRQGRRLRLRPPSSPARCPARRAVAGAAHQRARLLARPAEAAASRASTSPASAANAADPILALVRRRPPRHAHGQARPGQARPLPLRHPPAGRRRDRVLHDRRRPGCQDVLAHRRARRCAGPRALQLARHDARAVGSPDAGAEGDFSVLRYDHPGHGLGSPRPVSSVEELGRGVLEILDGHAIDRVSFCGLSLGGAVGQWLALHAPERIDRLVLACGSARFGTPESWRARIESVRAAASRRSPTPCSRSSHARDAPRRAGARTGLPGDDGLRRAGGVRGLLRGARGAGIRARSSPGSGRRRS